MDLLNIHRYLADEATQEEKRKLEKWIEESEVNRQKFESYREIYSVKIQNKYKYNTEKALSQFRLIMDKNDKAATKKSPVSGYKRRDKQPSSIWWKIAAMLLLSVGLSLYIFSSKEIMQDEQYVNETYGTTIATKPGEQKSFRLSDGSRIKLNADSEVYIPKGFGVEERVIELTGEAFFEISTVENIGFEIRTSSATVEILGTKFGIRNWRDREESIIAVLSGTVSVRSANSKIEKTVILTSGEYSRVTLTKPPTLPSHTDIEQYIGWTNRVFVFDETPLRDVLKELELHFNAQIEIEDSSRIDDPVTARYENETLKEILEYTSITHGTKFKYNQADDH